MTFAAAFVGGVNMALPSLTGESGICPALTEIIGSTDGLNQWQDFLTTGSQTAQEFDAAWKSLKLEASQCSEFLGMELDCPLSCNTVLVGSVAMVDSTRHSIVHEREVFASKFLRNIFMTTKTARPDL